MRGAIRWLGVGCPAAGAAAGLWVAARPGQQPAPPVLPDPADVDHILVRCPPFQEVVPGTAEFRVPPEYVGAVLHVLGPPQLDPERDRWVDRMDEVATLRVVRRDGREVVVRVYFWGKESARYSVDGVHCVRGGAYVGNPAAPIAGGSPGYTVESLLIAQLLRAMEHQPMAPEPRTQVSGYLAELDRSAARTVDK